MAKYPRKKRQLWRRMRSYLQFFHQKQVIIRLGRVEVYSNLVEIGFIALLLFLLDMLFGLEVHFLGLWLDLMQLSQWILVLGLMLVLVPRLAKGLPRLAKGLMEVLWQLRFRRQTRLWLIGHLRYVLPEECVAELAVLYQRLKRQRFPHWQIRCFIMWEALELIVGVYIRIKFDNLWLPGKTKSRQIDDE